MTLPVVILAGGLGTRLRSLTGLDLPKAMVDVGGRPFIDRKIEELVAHGVNEVVLLVGHGAEALLDHIGDGSRLGVKARLVDEGPTLLGTGGAIAAALEELPETFWVTYGDSLLFAPMEEIERRFLDSGSAALMTVLRNDDQWQPSNVSIDGGRVVAYEKPPRPGRHHYIDYGLLLFERSVFLPYAPGEAFDLSVVLDDLIRSHHLLAHEVHERFRDIGTPEAHAETDQLFLSGPPTQSPG